MTVKIKKSSKIKLSPAANENEFEPPVLGPAETPDVSYEALATGFAPTVENRLVADLTPNPRNARKHPKKQISQLAAVMKAMGFLVPIIVDEKGMVLAGHGRLEAAQLNRLAEVPTIQVKHLTPALKRLFALADNRMAELSGWEDDILRIELTELAVEYDLNIELTGFETCDIDLLTAPKAANDPDEMVPEVEREKAAISAPGDLWKLGAHLLYCGSATEDASYKTLMGDQTAEMMFSDPPYNVKINGHVCGLGSVHHQEFKMASGEMNKEEFTAFLNKFMTLAAQHSKDGAIHYVCMDWRHVSEVIAAAKGAYTEQKNLCVWNKSNAGMGAFYRSQHELVFVYKVGTAAHINNFGLGGRGRYRTNVWDYAGVNTFKRGRLDELQMHPTVKPLAMVVDALKDCSKVHGVVLDPFLGSGTTLLAAEKTHRICRAIELDPHYVDLAIRRWQDMTGKTAVHATSGKTFDDLAEVLHPTMAA